MTRAQFTLSAAFLPLLALLFPACAASPKLTMSPQKEIVDHGAHMDLAAKNYQAGMVVPPLEEKVATLQELTDKWDTALIESGTRAISSAPAMGFREAVRAAGAASDPQAMSHAIAAVKQSGADFVFVIDRFDWSADERPTRFFVGDGETDFKEVDMAGYQSWEGAKYAFSSPVFELEGKVVDVASSEVVATLDVDLPANWCLTASYTATMAEDKDRWAVESANYDYGDKSWLPAAKESAENRAIAHAIQIVRPKKAVPGTPPPKNPQ